MKKLLLVVIISLSSYSAVYACATADLIALGIAGDSSIILSRPDTQHEWITPDDLFIIHFDTEGPHAVYRAYEDVDPADGIPDYVNRCADYLHLSHTVIVDNLGFDAPPIDDDRGGDSRYDIYLTNTPALTTPELPSNEYPGRPAYSSFIQLGHDLRIPRYPDNPYPFLKISAAHEYFHAVEFAYRAYSDDLTPWWFESCAVWIEDLVFDEVNDSYFLLPTYLGSLHKSLYRTTGQFIYGSWLFPETIYEIYGHDLIRNCWETFASFDIAMDALDISLNEFGIDLNTEYCRHIIWNYFTDYNYRDGFYEEGADFEATVSISAIYNQYPVEWSQPPIPQQNVSGVYIEFDRPEIVEGDLVLEYDNPTSDQQYLGIAAVRRDGRVEYSIHRVEHSVSPSYYVNDFAGCEKVILMPVWGYEGHQIDGTTTYNYRAYIDSVGTYVTSGSETPSRFELTGAYPNPFNNSVTISYASPQAGEYNLRVYDVVGRLILERHGSSQSGLNRIGLQMPESLAGGVMFYVLSQDDFSSSGKVMYLK